MIKRLIIFSFFSSKIWRDKHEIQDSQVKILPPRRLFKAILLLLIAMFG